MNIENMDLTELAKEGAYGVWIALIAFAFFGQFLILSFLRQINKSHNETILKVTDKITHHADEDELACNRIEIVRHDVGSALSDLGKIENGIADVKMDLGEIKIDVKQVKSEIKEVRDNVKTIGRPL